MVEVLVKESDRRGGDSWGVAAPMAGTHYEIYKGMGNLGDDKFAKCLSAFDTLYGHTRKATTGKAALRNAHPFQVNHIVGAHNGMISNYTAMNKKYKRNCEVDSHHIFYHLAENRTLDELDGWGAIWWFRRAAPGKVLLFKESKYNLSVFGIGEHGKNVVGVVFISDDRDGRMALDALGRPYFEYEFGPNYVYQIPSWSTLEKTDKKMAFGRRSWYGDTRPLALPTFTHLGREARSLPFKEKAVVCSVCRYIYIYTYRLASGERACMDCFEFVLRNQPEVSCAD